MWLFSLSFSFCLFITFLGAKESSFVFLFCLFISCLRATEYFFDIFLLKKKVKKFCGLFFFSFYFVWLLFITFLGVKESISNNILLKKVKKLCGIFFFNFRLSFTNVFRRQGISLDSTFTEKQRLLSLNLRLHSILTFYSAFSLYFCLFITFLGDEESLWTIFLPRSSIYYYHITITWYSYSLFCKCKSFKSFKSLGSFLRLSCFVLALLSLFFFPWPFVGVFSFIILFCSSSSFFTFLFLSVYWSALKYYFTFFFHIFSVTFFPWVFFWWFFSYYFVSVIFFLLSPKTESVRWWNISTCATVCQVTLPGIH